ncbi:MAG: MarR family winged helix-turn-helix transcriptional regulator [Firmicutes bacterium]|nr:MarR family winged helix-turn-helix transcriptional regulator [Bacillota bacterium]
MDVTDDLVLAIEEMIRNQRKQYRAVTIDLPISGAEMQALMMINRKSPLTVTELADRLHVGQSATSKIVQRLTDLELAIKIVSDTDQRRHVVTLSTKGQDLVQTVRIRRHATWGAWLSRLSPDDQVQLLIILRKFNGLVSDNIPSPPSSTTGE